MKNYLLLLVLPIVISCKRTEEAPIEDGFNLYFESPQPINDSELNHFPIKYRGLYVTKDSFYIRIEEKLILDEYYYKFRIHNRLLDSLKNNFVLSNGKLIEKETNEVYDVLKKGDSIELSQKKIDTLYMLSNSLKAKRINGQLVLSTKDSIFWKVKLMSLENKVLKIRSIYSRDDLKKLDSITKIKSTTVDSINFISKPTRSEFKKILNLKNLGFEKSYKKISN